MLAASCHVRNSAKRELRRVPRAGESTGIVGCALDSARNLPASSSRRMPEPAPSCTRTKARQLMRPYEGAILATDTAAGGRENITQCAGRENNIGGRVALSWRQTLAHQKLQIRYVGRR